MYGSKGSTMQWFARSLFFYISGGFYKTILKKYVFTGKSYAKEHSITINRHRSTCTIKGTETISPESTNIRYFIVIGERWRSFCKL